MRLNTDIPELEADLKFILAHNPKTAGMNLSNAFHVSQERMNTIHIDYRPVVLTLEVYAENGSLVLDIQKARVYGMGLFGAVRKIAGGKVIKALRPYEPIVGKVTRVRGNIHIENGLLYVNSLLMNGDRLILNAEARQIRAD